MTWRRLPIILALLMVLPLGCLGRGGKPDLIWGKRGVNNGQFVRPRACTLGPDDRLYIVDYTARIQAFDLDGKYLGPTWSTPDYRVGRPSGLDIDREGNVLVCDSHYHCVRTYTPQGQEIPEKKLGGTAGHEPGQFGYISAAVQDADGFYYIAEFELNERITKLDANGRFVKCWGQAGTAPGEFSRIRGMTLGPDGLLYVADAINHRIQVFTREGEWVRAFGRQGDGPGELSYPYRVAFGPKGDLYVVEYENHRVQKFTPEGRSLACWGSPGRGPGQLYSPWAIAVDRKDRVHVIDTENHRVQRVRF